MIHMNLNFEVRSMNQIDAFAVELFLEPEDVCLRPGVSFPMRMQRAPVSHVGRKREDTAGVKINFRPKRLTFG